MSEASDQITEYLSVGGLFNPEMMNQTQHEAVRDTLIKARDDIQRLGRWNAALREQVEELDAKWKMAEDQCFDQVGKIGELERENAALRAWKESALAVEREWDAQVTAQILGARLGESCRRAIAREVPKLVVENAALRTVLKRWLKVADDCHLEQQEVGYSEYNITAGLMVDTRALLDAARKEAKP